MDKFYLSFTSSGLEDGEVVTVVSKFQAYNAEELLNKLRDFVVLSGYTCVGQLVANDTKGKPWESSDL